MADVGDGLVFVVKAWAVLWPLWGLVMLALATGRVAMPREAVARGIVWTLKMSGLIALPLAWAGFTYLTSYNPRFSGPRADIGGVLALLTFPVYSSPFGMVPFESAVEKARQSSGNRPRPLVVRLISNLFIAVAFVVGLVFLGAMGLLAGGAR